MLLTRHATTEGERWAVDGEQLDAQFSLARLLALASDGIGDALSRMRTGRRCEGPLRAPLDAHHEVWAAGVTYLNSRLAREAESQSADVYQRVYVAERPELFFKANGWRVRGHGEAIRVRPDSAWNVPEPELALVINRAGAIVGFTVGNDVSSRSIEGENPLYLPQAKIYDGACALGPGIRLAPVDAMRDLEIGLTVQRDGAVAFSGRTRTSQIKRHLGDLAAFLMRDLEFPGGAVLLTGTGIVPGEDFTLREHDRVRIEIDGLVLENPVQGS